METIIPYTAKWLHARDEPQVSHLLHRPLHCFGVTEVVLGGKYFLLINTIFWIGHASASRFGFNVPRRRPVNHQITVINVYVYNRKAKISSILVYFIVFIYCFQTVAATFHPDVLLFLLYRKQVLHLHVHWDYDLIWTP